MTDTIYALSSGPPPAAIAVVRISGPRAGAALQALIGRVPSPRQAALALVRSASGDVIDQALALYFPAPASETGEDVAELQLHGGRAVIAATFAALGKVEGLRPAEAGEFTRRAFSNGKMDLTRVEGLADLIAADTEAQRRQAYRQHSGVLAEKAETWRGELIRALALAEAVIDFPDEEDVPQDELFAAKNCAQQLLAGIEEMLESAKAGERLREGLVVAIAGPPNAGKSSLLNRIARREAAIVSPYAGTTRDVIEIHLDLGGYPVTLLDTAGLRDSPDPVEQEGVRRARARIAAADLVLWVVDATAPQPPTGGARTWTVLNKTDLLAAAQHKIAKGRDDQYSVSALTGDGIDALLDSLLDYARHNFGSIEPALVTRERQRAALTDTVAALSRAVATKEGEELVAEELRLAARALGRLTGRVDVEDVLDVIFRDFCIGK
jgi:tRNA modification GTPase